MVKKILKGAVVVTGAFLAAAAAGTFWLTGTESGLKTVVSAVRAALPAFSVEKVEGTLFHPTFRNVAFAETGTEVLLRELTWKWRWKDLFSRRVTFDLIKADGAAVKVAATQTSTASDAVPAAESSVGLPDWLPKVTLSQVTITDASVEAAGTTVSVKSFQTGVRFHKGHLTVEEAALAGVRVTLPESETSAAPTDLQALQTTLKTSGLADWLPGDVTLPIGVVVSSFKGEDWALVQGRDVTQVNDAAVSLRYEDGHLAIEDCRVGMPQYGEAQLSGTMQTYGAWSMQLNAQVKTTLTPQPVTLKANLSGALKDEIRGAFSTDGWVTTAAAVSLQPAQPRLPLAVTGKLRAPLTLPAADRTVTLDGTDWQLQGFVDEARLSVGSRVLLRRGKDEKAYRTTVSALTSLVEMRDGVIRVEDERDKGAVTLKGKAGWLNGVKTAGQLAAERFSWKEAGFDLKKAQGSVTFSAQEAADGWRAALHVPGFAAVLNERAVSVKGKLSYDGTFLTAEAFDVAAGKNTVTANGRWGTTEVTAGALTLKVDAPQLSDIDASLSGTVKGTVNLFGTTVRPGVDADLTATSLAAAGVTAERIRLKGRFSEAADEKLTLRVKNAAVGSRLLRRVGVTLTGKLSSHQLTFKANEAEGLAALATTINGSADFVKKRWQGTLTTLTAEAGPSRWTLQAPSRWSVSAEEITGESLLLAGGTSKAGRLATRPFRMKGDRLSAGVEELRLVSDDFVSLLPHGMKMTGTITAEASVEAKGGRLTWKARAESNRWGIGRPAQGRRKAAGIEIKALDWSAQGQDDNASGTGRLTAAGAPVAVNFELRDGKLSAGLKTQKLPLSGLTVWLPSDTTLAGDLTTDLTVSGEAAAPKLTGTVKLTDFSATTPDVPFEMAPSTVEFTGRGSEGVLTADIRTKKGAAAVEGHFDWQDLQNPSAHVKVASEGLQIRSDAPVVRLTAAPNLTVTYENGTADVKGTVKVPRGYIAVTDMPEGAVSPSSDEVLVDDEAKDASAAARVNAAVTVEIGDRVFVNVMGLKSRLTGTLAAEQTKGRLAVNGRIALENGTFKAYGQDLEVTKGLLIFAGPADNPTLDIIAVRNTESTDDGVQAGVNVSGTAAAPKVTLFSDPAMSEENKLSYLLTGHGLDNSGDADSTSMMTTALIGLGASQTGRVVGSVGEALGIRGLTVDTAGGGDDTQVVVSGYVLPGLQVKYGMGVFDAVTTLTLKYRLLPQLYLQAVSGESQNLGLLWKFKL